MHLQKAELTGSGLCLLKTSFQFFPKLNGKPAQGLFLKLANFPNSFANMQANIFAYIAMYCQLSVTNLKWRNHLTPEHSSMQKLSQSIEVTLGEDDEGFHHGCHYIVSKASWWKIQ